MLSFVIFFFLLRFSFLSLDEAVEVEEGRGGKVFSFSLRSNE